MLTRDQINRRLLEIRTLQNACDKVIQQGRPKAAQQNPLHADDAIEIVDPSTHSSVDMYEVAVTQKAALAREEEMLRNEMKDDFTEEDLNEDASLLQRMSSTRNVRTPQHDEGLEIKEHKGLSLEEVPLIQPKEKTGLSAAHLTVAGILIEDEMTRLNTLAQKYEKVNPSVGAQMGLILMSDQPVFEKLANLHKLLDNKVKGEKLFKDDNKKFTLEAFVVREIIVCMNAINTKLKRLSLPATREDFDARAVEKLKRLTDNHFKHALAKIPAALAELKDEHLQALGEMQPLTRNKSGKPDEFLLLIEHQFKGEEPWKFFVNLELLQEHRDQFKREDHYLINKLAALIHIKKALGDKTTTNSEKISLLDKYLQEKNTLPVLRAHRNTLTSYKSTESDKYAEAITTVIKTAKEIGNIIEKTAKSGKRQPK